MQASASPSQSARQSTLSPASSTAATEATEIEHRPPPGTLQSGRYEAPPWLFYVAAAAVVLLAAAYFGVRLGLINRLRNGPRAHAGRAGKDIASK